MISRDRESIGDVFLKFWRDIRSLTAISFLFSFVLPFFSNASTRKWKKVVRKAKNGVEERRIVSNGVE